MSTLTSQVVDDLLEQDFDQIDFGGPSFTDSLPTDLQRALTILSQGGDSQYLSYRLRKDLEDADLIGTGGFEDSIELTVLGNKVAMELRARDVIVSTWDIIAGDVEHALRHNPVGQRSATVAGAAEAALEHMDMHSVDPDALTWIHELPFDDQETLARNALRQFGYAEESVEEDAGQYFTLGSTVYNVDRAEQYIEAHPDLEQNDVPLEDILRLAGLILIDKEYAMGTDPAAPGILVLDEIGGERAGLLIDGWHRAFKLGEEGAETMRVHVIRDPDVVAWIKGETESVEEQSSPSFDQIDFGGPTRDTTGRHDLAAGRARWRAEIIRWMQDHVGDEVRAGLLRRRTGEREYSTWTEIARAAMYEFDVMSNEIPDWMAVAAKELLPGMFDESIEEESIEEQIEVGSTGTYLVNKVPVPVTITGQEEIQGVTYWVAVDTSSNRKMYVYTPANFTPTESIEEQVSFDQIDFGEPDSDFDTRDPNALTVWIHIDELPFLLRGVTDDEVASWHYIVGAVAHVVEITFDDLNTMVGGVGAISELGIPVQRPHPTNRPQATGRPVPRPDEEEVREWMRTHWDDYTSVMDLADEVEEEFYFSPGAASVEDQAWLLDLARETPLEPLPEDVEEQVSFDQIDFGASLNRSILSFFKQRDDESWSQKDITRHIIDTWGLNDYVKASTELARRGLLEFGDGNNYHLTPEGEEWLATESVEEQVTVPPSFRASPRGAHVWLDLEPYDTPSSERYVRKAAEAIQMIAGQVGVHVTFKDGFWLVEAYPIGPDEALKVLSTLLKQHHITDIDQLPLDVTYNRLQNYLTFNYGQPVELKPAKTQVPAAATGPATRTGRQGGGRRAIPRPADWQNQSVEQVVNDLLELRSDRDLSDEAFEGWLEKVNAELVRLIGRDRDGIADWRYWDDFEDGVSPQKAARSAIEYHCELHGTDPRSMMREQTNFDQIDFGEPEVYPALPSLEDLTPFQNSVFDWMIERSIDHNYEDWMELLNDTANEWELHPPPDWLTQLAQVVVSPSPEVEEQSHDQIDFGTPPGEYILIDQSDLDRVIDDVLGKQTLDYLTYEEDSSAGVVKILGYNEADLWDAVDKLRAANIRYEVEREQVIHYAPDVTIDVTQQEQMSPLSPDFVGGLSPDAGNAPVSPNRGNVTGLATTVPAASDTATKTHEKCAFYGALGDRLGWGRCSNSASPYFEKDVEATGAPCGEFQWAALPLESIEEQIDFDRIDWGDVGPVEFYNVSDQLNNRHRALQPTSFLGYIRASFDSLVDVFGEPYRAFEQGDKVDAEWALRSNSGAELSIYNYKDGPNYNRDGGIPVEDIRIWHVACNRAQREAVIATFKDLLIPFAVVYSNLPDE